MLKRALELLVAGLEKQKFAATTRPGPSRPSASARHIPAAVKRAVRERDGDRCTFVSDAFMSDKRAEARANAAARKQAKSRATTAEHRRVVQAVAPAT